MMTSSPTTQSWATWVETMTRQPLAVLQILGHPADQGPVSDAAARAQPDAALEDYVGPDLRARPDHHPRAYEAVGTDHDSGGEVRSRVHDGRRMDACRFNHLVRLRAPAPASREPGTCVAGPAAGLRPPRSGVSRRRVGSACRSRSPRPAPRSAPRIGR